MRVQKSNFKIRKEKAHSDDNTWAPLSVVKEHLNFQSTVIDILVKYNRNVMAISNCCKCFQALSIGFGTYFLPVLKETFGNDGNIM
jgi:hypothetical protein